MVRVSTYAGKGDQCRVSTYAVKGNECRGQCQTPVTKFLHGR